MRRLGRAGRQRRKHGRRLQCPETEVDMCADLRKWMVSRCSKQELATTFKLVPFYFPDTGRGLKTKTRITPETVIVTVPQRLLLTPSIVLNSHISCLVKRWHTHFTPHQLLALFLIVERNRGSDSEWQPFIDSLPSEYTLPHYFSPDELNLLPPLVLKEAQNLIQRSCLAYKQILQFCSSHWDDADRWASWDMFLWAWCTVNSRSIFLETEEGTEQFLDLGTYDENFMALCPYLDLINHASTATVHAGINREKREYEIITFDSYQPHEQVFISYAPHDNRNLFLHYGFTLPHNVHNSVCFSVDDFVKLRDMFNITCWEQKMAVLMKNNLHRELSCTMEGVSWNLMSALKLLALNWEQLQTPERVLTGDDLSPAVLTCARRMAKLLINQALVKAQALLAKQASGPNLSAHNSIARSLASDEVNILNVALRDVS